MPGPAAQERQHGQKSQRPGGAAEATEGDGSDQVAGVETELDQRQDRVAGEQVHLKRPQDEE
jgi:hypothetical protein